MTVQDEVLFDMPEHCWRRRRCLVCGGALSVTHTHTYVVARQCWAKIGATSNVRRRINELRRPAWTKHLLSPVGMDWTEPLTTLAVLDGDAEHELHLRFSDLHAHGEWFTLAGDLQSWLDEIRVAS